MRERGRKRIRKIDREIEIEKRRMGEREKNR